MESKTNIDLRLGRYQDVLNDVECDSHAGAGTTLISASQLNRISIGSEEEEQTYNKAVLRIKAGFTPDMFAA